MAIDINNEYYQKGIDIISRTKENRIATNKNLDFIQNAIFRLSQVPNDEYWTNEKKKYEDEIKVYHEEAAVLETELHYLKDNMDYETFTDLLERYGNVLAETTRIDHVKNNLSDEYELSKAIGSTIQMLWIKSAELEKAIEDDNKDYAVVVNSEIKYFRNDLRLHHWGLQMLEKFDNEYKEKQGMSK